ncbi:MAG: hypothetical protein HY924_01130 [Elusimicrobia bacterium]|nr:hypothetical protein [Elusimicrobiota bacterium]
MNRILILALALGAFWAAPVRAEDSSSGYTAEVRNNFLFSTDDGAKGFVGEYDGRQYDGYEGAFDFSAFGPFAGKGPYTVFEGGVSGINSAEEEARLLFLMGDFLRISGNFDTITHRQRYFRTGIELNKTYWQYNFAMPGEGDGVSTLYKDEWFNRGGLGFPRQRETYFARRFYDLSAQVKGVPLVDALYFDFYRNTDFGNTYTRFAQSGQTTNASEVPVDRQVNEESLGFGLEFGEDAGAVYMFSYRDFQDYVFGPTGVPATATIDYPLEPPTPHTRWHIHDVKYRWNPSQDTSVSGAMVFNDRKNLNDGFRTRIFTASLNSMYTGIKHLVLYSRLNARNMNVRENKEFWDSNGNAGTADRRVSADQIDRGAFRGEIGARYKVIDPVELKASYRLDYVRRTNAPTEQFNNQAVYSSLDAGRNAVDIPYGTHSNGVAEEDTQHRMNVEVEVELPFEASLGGHYKKMYANRPAFESEPTWRDEAGAELFIPCPMGFYVDGGFDYVGQRNDVSNFTKTASFGREWRGGAGWSGKYGSAAVNYAYDKYKTHAEGWFGTSNYVSATITVVDLLYDPSMNHVEENNTLSANGRVNLPAGFTLLANGAYTRSVSGTPVHLEFDWFRTGASQAGRPVGDVTDLQPREVRIQRLGLGFEYAPPALKSLTASFNYRSDRWDDRTDGLNNGKYDVYNVGVNWAF